MLAVAVADVGGRRELQAILTLYLGTLLSGYSSGFSAVSVPAMREEVRSNSSHSDIPPVELTEDELSWFGNYLRTSTPSQVLTRPSLSQSAASPLVRWLAVLLVATVVAGLVPRGQYRSPVSQQFWAGSSSPPRHTSPPSSWAGFSVVSAPASVLPIVPFLLLSTGESHHLTTYHRYVILIRKWTIQSKIIKMDFLCIFEVL